ncbi:MAG TPA: MMPL family transporter [Solirubrobacteraceae bacterium]|nr:MMPL family transporter [Solirubrobacteraceae bacterium]
MSPPAPPGRLGRLADFTHRRRRTVVLAWIVALVAAFAAAGAAGDWSADYATPGSESRAAAELLQERFPARSPDTVDVVWQAAAGADAPALQTRIDGLAKEAAGLEGIGEAAPAAQAEYSRDGTVGVLRVPLTALPGAIPVETGERFIALADKTAGAGLRVELGGIVIANAEAGEISSEAVGMAIAAFVLLLTFGSVVAAGLPLATALFGLGISTGVIGLLAAVLDVPDWAPALASMLGIGVGIDYALLIITRYRAALAGGLDTRGALVEAISTAGRSVLIAGTTVVISLMGLFLMGLPYLYGAAVATIVAVLVVMAASVTLVPALLAIAGPRIDRLRIPGVNRAPDDPRDAPAARWGRRVQQRPWLAAIAGVAVLLVLASPFAGLRLGFPDRGNDAADTTTRQAYDLVAGGFGPGANGPLLVAAESGDEQKLTALASTLREQPGVAAVSGPALNPGRDAAVITVVPTTSPQDRATEDLVHHLRDDILPAAGLPVALGGATAAFMDQSAATAERLPLFIGGVVGLSFLLLLFSFRSVTVAVKAGAMNLLSIAAAYGVVAYLAEGGWAGQLVGIDTETPVPPFIPVIMFAVLFGLSMDYEVFLLSRVREEFLARGDTARAVTEGLARTARVITAAALIMVAVFGAFALSPDVSLKLIGLGLAAAILVDATVVRMVLVPAVMQLLGDRNWWLPGWLDRLLPEGGLEGPAPAPAA